MEVLALPQSLASINKFGGGIVTSKRSAALVTCKPDSAPASAAHATTAELRTRKRLWVSAADPIVHTNEDGAGNAFAPVFQDPITGRIYGWQLGSAGRYLAYSDNGTTWSATWDLGAIRFKTGLAYNGRLFLIVYDNGYYKLYATDTWGSMTAVPMAGGRTALTLPPWRKMVYDPQHDSLVSASYGMGSVFAVASPTVGSFSGGKTTITKSIAFWPGILEGQTNVRVKFDTSSNEYVVASVDSVNQISVTGDAHAETGNIHLINLHDEIVHVPNAMSTAAVGSLLATSVYSLNNNSSTNQYHFHDGCFHAATGVLYYNTGDGYGKQFALVSTDGGANWSNMMGVGTLDPSWQNTACADFGHADRIYTGGDLYGGIGALKLTAPFTQGLVVADEMRVEMRSTFPGTGDSLQEVAALWTINGIRFAATAGNPASPAVTGDTAGEVYVFDEVSGEMCRFYSLPALVGSGIFLYGGYAAGRMHFYSKDASGTETHVSLLIPTTRLVDAVCVANQQTNLLTASQSRADTLSDWTKDAVLTEDIDTSAAYVPGAAGGYRMTGSGLTLETAVGSKLASAVTVTSGQSYIVSVWVKATRCKRLGVVVSTDGSGTPMYFPRRYDGAWQRLQCVAYAATSTTLKYKVVAIPDEYDGGVSVTVGGAVVVKASDATPWSVAKGVGVDWVVGGATSGYEGLWWQFNQSAPAAPATFSWVWAFRTDFDWFNYVPTGASPGAVWMAGTVEGDPAESGNGVSLYFNRATNRWELALDDGAGTLSGAVAVTTTPSAGTTDRAFPRRGRIFLACVTCIPVASTSTRMFATLFPIDVGLRWDDSGAAEATGNTNIVSRSTYWYGAANTLLIGKLDDTVTRTILPGYELLGAAVIDGAPSWSDLVRAAKRASIADWAAEFSALHRVAAVGVGL